MFEMLFASVYPAYVNNAELKSRTKEEVGRIICWLTGSDQTRLLTQIERKADFKSFFGQAREMNESGPLIKGIVCGVRVE